jgi:hypothetical protein
MPEVDDWLTDEMLALGSLVQRESSVARCSVVKCIIALEFGRSDQLHLNES